MTSTRLSFDCRVKDWEHRDFRSLGKQYAACSGAYNFGPSVLACRVQQECTDSLHCSSILRLPFLDP